VDALRAELARLIALRDAGHCSEAEQLAKGLIPRVRAAGYAPLLADTTWAAGYLTNDCLDVDIGAPWYKEAVVAGLSSGHDEAAAAAAILLGGLLADRKSPSDAGRDWLSIGRATLTRIGNHPRLEGWYHSSEGIALQADGHSLEAAEAHKEASRILEGLLGKDHPDAGLSLANQGSSYLTAGRYEDAVQVSARAREQLTAVLGAEHPKVAIPTNNEGEALNMLGRHSEARKAFQAAMDIWHKSGADPIFLSYGLTGLGIALTGEGHAGEAIPMLEEALRTRTEKHTGAENLGQTRFALARALWSRPAEHERALGLARAAYKDVRDTKTATGRRMAAEIDAWVKAPK
jgi:tetratricopeptide (TPR) repeat protein